MFMKTRLTLLAVALFAVCAYAANFWKAAEDTPTAAGTVLVDDDLMTAKTVFATTLKASNATIAGEEFTHYIQVRNAANPSADNPNGTENEGSTSIELNVKKDLTLTFFYRRQSTAQEETGGVYASNDGKDLKIFNKEDFSNLDGELTIDHETEDFKYGFVKKTYQVSPGNYVVSARGTTIQFFGMTHEGVEVVPTIGPAIDITIESGKDISAELAAAMQGNPMPESITIKLAAGGSYTIGQTINTAAPLTVAGDAGDPATIDASELSAPLFAISTTPYESTLDANNFYAIGDIAFCNIIVKGIKQQFIYGNKVKSLIGKLTLDNSVLEVAGGSKTVFDFNGGGVVGELAITNSTIYGNPQNTGALYSSQSGQKATEAGLDMQKFTLKNSTFYNIAYGKNVSSHRQSNQTWLGYEVKNCLVVDCGKDGQFIKGLNGGQSGKNPVWDIEGNSFQRIVEGVMTDISANEETGDDDEPVKDNVEGVVVFAGDYASGDLTLGNCPQNTAKVGDPRWLNDTNFYKFVATEWPAGDPGRISPDNVTVDETANTITVSQTGQNNVALIFRSSNVYTVPATDHYFIIKATGLSVNEGDSYLWWLNNTNNGGSYKPTVIYEEDGQTVFAWDVNVISIGGLLGTEDAEFKDEGGWSTTFGMTLADANVPAVISYIGFTDEIAEPLDEAEYAWDPTLWVAGDPGRISPDKVVADVDAKTITVSQTGDNNVALVYKTDKVLYVNNAKYFVILGKGLSTTDTKSYLWWLNNTNNGTQVPPTYAVENADGLVYFIWNIAESGLGASFETPKTYLVGDATWNTTFGLTLADDTVPAVISYIGYEGENSSIVAEAKAMLEGINQVRINGMNDGTVYNLNGQKVNNPSKGIYIINGKKVVIK